jgi:hypothetical protein
MKQDFILHICPYSELLMTSFENILSKKKKKLLSDNLEALVSALERMAHYLTICLQHPNINAMKAM